MIEEQLERIAVALEQIAKNTKPSNDEEDNIDVDSVEHKKDDKKQNVDDVIDKFIDKHSLLIGSMDNRAIKSTTIIIGRFQTTTNIVKKLIQCYEDYLPYMDSSNDFIDQVIQLWEEYKKLWE
jgi:hypothetical protein